MNIFCRPFTFFFLSFLAIASHAQEKGATSNGGSLIIDFNYENSALTLPGEKIDGNTTRTFLENASLDSSYVSDINKDATAQQYKALFKQSIQREVAKGKGLNFNFSGYGLRLPTGGWGIVLPSMKSLGEAGIQTCTDWAKNTKSSDPAPEQCLEHMFTSKEFTEIAGEDVTLFSLIDDCHPGALFASGVKKFNFLTKSGEEKKESGKCKESEDDKIASYLERIKKDKKLKCSLDKDKDNKITFDELSEGLNQNNESSSTFGEVGDAQEDVSSDTLGGETNESNSKNTVIVTLKEYECADEMLKGAAKLASQTLTTLNSRPKTQNVTSDNTARSNSPDKDSDPGRYNIPTGDSIAQ